MDATQQVLIIIGIIYLTIGALISLTIWKALNDEEIREKLDVSPRMMSETAIKKALVLFAIGWPIFILLAILQDKNKNTEENIEEEQ
jgi:hypothetical protein